MITAAGAPGELQATFVGALLTARAIDPARRTVAGVAAPYGVPGVVSSGETVIFEPGSLDASARPVLLRDHDRTRPIGTVVDAVDVGTAMHATARVSATPDGNDALVLAADGALPMFSVGAAPTEWDYDADGVLHVHAADWLELSLLTIGAYADARVLSVTATRPEREPMPPDTLTDDPTTTDPDDPADDDELEPNPDIDPDVPVVDPPADVTAGARPVPLTAGQGRRRARPAVHPYAAVNLAAMARLICASRIDQGARDQLWRIMTSPGARVAPAIEAALADVTLVGTNNVGAAFRPGYQAELVDIVSHGSPAVDMIRQGDLERGDYPNKTFNAWTKTPEVALQATEKAEVNSVPVAIGPTSVPVRTWATANDISQQTLDFGSPSFVEDYVRAAGVDYAEVIDVYAITTMMAAATNAPTVLGDTLPTIIAKMFAALDPTKVPAGQMGMLVSWDLGVGAMGVKGTDETPVFWDGNINFGSFMPAQDMGGLTITVDPNMPARSALLMLRNAATWYDLPGTPFTLRAINVGQLGLDIAVYGYGALGVQFPGALVKTTVPAV